MTTVESLLSWETQKLKQLSDESGDVAKIINVFREFLATAANERQRFADERNVLSQQVKVNSLLITLEGSRNLQHEIWMIISFISRLQCI